MKRNWISLINYEGDCLAFSENTRGDFDIKDQYGEIVKTCTGGWLLEFASGLHTITDSRGYEWDFTRQSQDAVISDNKLFKVVNKGNTTKLKDTVSTLQYIGGRMKVIKKYGLEAEVIMFALKAMKENPNLAIDQAFEMGCSEWDV